MDLMQILKDALCHDEKVIKQSEMNINNLASQNFGGFLIELAEILSNEGVEKGIRQISATIIKNMIVYNQLFLGRYSQLDQESKMQIKNRVLSTLASSEKEVRKAAALAVVGIAKLEVPNNEWPDLFDIFVSTCQNEDRNIQLSSIITLGYIAQELSIRDIYEEHVNICISAIFQKLDESNDEEILNESIQAFLLFLPFAKMNFSNDNHRNMLFKIIIKHTQNTVENIRYTAFLCIIEVARLYYDLIADLIPELLSLSLIHTEKDSEKIGILIYEIWCSIADTEITRTSNKPGIQVFTSKHYCQANFPSLLKMIYTNIPQKPSNTSSTDGASLEDDLDWNISRSAVCLLSLLSQCCDISLINSVIDFIGNNIHHTNQTNKENGMLAFGAILVTKHKKEMIDLVFSSIETIIKFLTSQSSNNSLKETTSWVLLRIAKFYGEIFESNSTVFDSLITSVFTVLPHCRRRQACLLISTIHYFAKNLRNEQNYQQNCFSKFTEGALKTFIEFAYKKDAYDSQDNIAAEAFNAIGAIIQNATLSCEGTIRAFFVTLQNAFQATFNLENFKNEKIRDAFQAYISHCFFSALTSGLIQMDFASAKNLTDMIIESFKQRNGIYEEGLLAISSLALNIGKDFEPIFKDSFGQYLIFALKSTSDVSLCKNAIISTTEVIRALEEKFSVYADQIIPIVFEIITDANVDKTLRPYCFCVFSDIFISCGDHIAKYLGGILELVTKALEAASVPIKEDDDPDNLDYYAELREKLIECIHIIFIFVKENNKTNDFKIYVPQILDFINRINKPDFTPSVNIIRDSLGIISDFCLAYRTDIKNQIDMGIINEMINNLKSQINKAEYDRFIKLVEYGIKNAIK